MKPVECMMESPPAVTKPHSSTRAPSRSTAAAPNPLVRRVYTGNQIFVDKEVSNMRRTIAKRLTKSKVTISNFMCHDIAIL